MGRKEEPGSQPHRPPHRPPNCSPATIVRHRPSQPRSATLSHLQSRGASSTAVFAPSTPERRLPASCGRHGPRKPVKMPSCSRPRSGRAAPSSPGCRAGSPAGPPVALGCLPARTRGHAGSCQQPGLPRRCGPPPACSPSTGVITQNYHQFPRPPF